MLGSYFLSSLGFSITVGGLVAAPGPVAAAACAFTAAMLALNLTMVAKS